MRKFITSPLTSLIILVLGAQFFQIFITLALTQKGYSEFDIGLVHTASYIGLLISALYSEKIIHQIGHIRSFTAFSGLMTATMLIQALEVNLGIWMIARFFSGLSLAALYVTIESWLLAESNLLDRGKRLAIYMITLYLGQALSSQFLHVIDIQSMQPYLISALLCALAGIPVSLTHKPMPILVHNTPMKLQEIFKTSPYGFFGCFISGLALSGLYSFLPRYAINIEISVAWSMTSLICGGFILQWPFGKISDLFNREKVLMTISFACIIPSIILTSTTIEYIIYTMIFLTGGLAFALYPISIALTCDKLEKGRCIIQVTGVLLFSYGLGSVLGPMLVGAGLEHIRFNGVLFSYIGIVVAIFGITGVLAYRLNSKKSPTTESVDCVILPKQTPIANQLDPRQEASEGIPGMPEAANDKINEDKIILSTSSVCTETM